MPQHMRVGFEFQAAPAAARSIIRPKPSLANGEPRRKRIVTRRKPAHRPQFAWVGGDYPAPGPAAGMRKLGFEPSRIPKRGGRPFRTDRNHPLRASSTIW
jgi:hypothetical protein